MKTKKKFSIIQIAAVIVMLVLLALIIFFTVTNLKKSNEVKQLQTFSDNLTNAAEQYMDDKSDEFPNFNKVGDVTVISSSEMIEAGYIDENIDNPTGKELTDFYIKATIKADKSISYEVVG